MEGLITLTARGEKILQISGVRVPAGLKSEALKKPADTRGEKLPGKKRMLTVNERKSRRSFSASFQTADTSKINEKITAWDAGSIRAVILYCF